MNRQTDKKGSRVNHAERNAKTQSHRTGAFATIFASLSSDGSSAPSHARARLSLALLTALLATLAFLTLAPSALASPPVYQSSFGSYNSTNPQAVTVDQQNGDVYVTDTFAGKVFRYTASGVPDDFTCGTCSSNALSGMGFDGGGAAVEVAIDRSGGPANGDIYVAAGIDDVVYVFANDGTPLGTLDGSTTANGFYSEACGVAVDQSNGNVYVGDYGNSVWRYTPSGGHVTNANYSGGITTAFNPCQVAADRGHVYAVDWTNSGPAVRYSASSFALSPTSQAGTVVDPTAKAVATSPGNGNGDLYVDEGDAIHVFDSTGASLYSFGSPADFGTDSAAVGVNGSNGRAYVADPTAKQVDVFAPASSPPVYQSSFGSYNSTNPQAVTVDQQNGDVYVTDTFAGKVFRYTASGVPDDFTCGTCSSNALSGMGFDGGGAAVEVAIDRSGGPANGDIYVAAGIDDVVYVFANDGTPLGTLDGSTTANNFYSEACGVAVDQSNGNVYVGDYGSSVWRYTPSGGHVTNANYSGGITTAFNPCQVAADRGHVYAVDWTNSGPAVRYSASSFALSPTLQAGTVVDPTAKAVATSPGNGNGDVYVDEGDAIHVFDSTGASLYSFGSPADFGTDSAAVGVNGSNGRAYVADPTAKQVDVFAPASSPPVYQSSFGSYNSTNPQAVTVDQQNGDVYVTDTFAGKVFRYTASGVPDDFTCGTCSSNALSGMGFDGGGAAVEVAIDRSGGPANGDIYVAAGIDDVVYVFANDGTPLGTLDGSTTANDFYSEACGVAVDQSNGNVYVGDYGTSVWRYTPSGGHVTNANYSGGITTAFNPCQVAADRGHVYAVDWDNSGPAVRYSASSFALSPTPRPAPSSIPRQRPWRPAPATATATSTSMRATRSTSLTPPAPPSTASAPPRTSAPTRQRSASTAQTAAPTSPTPPPSRSTCSSA